MIILYKVEIKDWGARDWGTPQIMSENVAWKGDNRQNLVFPTVFPRDFDTPRDLIYMLYLDWYDAKFSRKSGSFQKQCVFPLFSRQIKKELRFYLNSLIFNVDQLVLEPRTSRLWVFLRYISWNFNKLQNVEYQQSFNFADCRKLPNFAPLFNS